MKKRKKHKIAQRRGEAIPLSWQAKSKVKMGLQLRK
jgi:hypothetical protein